MGCFEWIFHKKKKNRKKKKGKNGKGKGANPHGKNDLPSLKTTRGGVAFEVVLRPPTRAAPPKQHKFVNSLQSAKQKKALADIRRLEELVKKGGSAKEAERKKDICLENKAELEKQFIEKAKQSVVMKVLPDKDSVAANMEALKERCKTARTRRKVAAVGIGEGDRWHGAGITSLPPVSI